MNLKRSNEFKLLIKLFNQCIVSSKEETYEYKFANLYSGNNNMGVKDKFKIHL